MTKRVNKSRISPVMLKSGQVIYMNQYNEFKAYVKMFQNTDFVKHYILFGGQIGVYRFNVNGKCHYIGYSCNLKDRVRTSFFERCFELDNVEFQYILCDTKEEAMDIEIHYIRLLKPVSNITGKNDTRLINFVIPEFCNSMEIKFNEYWDNINIM